MELAPGGARPECRWSTRQFQSSAFDLSGVKGVLNPERKGSMKTSPWYSIRPGETVHHDNTKCTEGNNIEAYYRRQGTGGLPLCHHCKQLDDAGQ